MSGAGPAQDDTRQGIDSDVAPIDGHQVTTSGSISPTPVGCGAICGGTSVWLGLTLALVLHHIHGHPANNRRVDCCVQGNVQIARPSHNLARVNLFTPNIDITAGRRHRKSTVLRGGMDLFGPLRDGLRVQYRRLCLRRR
jgi:hypothetical protein